MGSILSACVTRRAVASQLQQRRPLTARAQLNQLGRSNRNFTVRFLKNASRINCSFVSTKTPEQQSCLSLHRTRHLFVRQQTATINATRAHLAEFGIVAPVGRRGVEQLLKVVVDVNDMRLPEI